MAETTDTSKIVSLAEVVKKKKAVAERKRLATLKAKIDAWYMIWLRTPSQSEEGQKALGNIALHVSDLPEDDPEKSNLVDIVVRFYSDKTQWRALHPLLKAIEARAEKEQDLLEKLEIYKGILSSAFGGKNYKSKIAAIIFDLTDKLPT